MTVQSATATRARLWDSGFRPIAIYNPDSRATASPGKAPKGEDWHQKALANPPVDAIRDAEPDALNVGILCDGLRAIDIDVENLSMAQTIRSRAMERFGEAPLRYRDNSGRCLVLYRAAEGQPKKRVIKGTFGKVEVLGHGQQFVAFGVHPSGAELRWMPEAPGDVAADHLPAVTEDQITAFLADVAPIIAAEPEAAQRNGHTSPHTSKLGLRGDALQVVAALCAIPNTGPADWEAWNRIGMAAWAASGGSAAGLAAFHAWSEQHPSYDTDETERRWQHYAISPPTGIGAGTLFHLARQNREEPPPPASEFEDGEGSPTIAEPSPQPSQAKQSADLIDPRVWAQPAPPRQWIVENWIPRGVVTALYGDGGMGKSLLAQQLMTSTAIGQPWIGQEVLHGRALGIMCEDDEEELHRRQDYINQSMEIQAQDLGNLRYSARLGRDNVLMAFDGRDVGAITEAYNDIADLCQQFRPDLLVCDTIADFFGGNENNRSQVRQFVQNVFGRLARDFHCAVLACGHPSLSGMSSGTGTGGSTAWNNTVRSRLYLTAQEGEGADPNIRVLTRKKANYAARDAEINLVWRAGCLIVPGEDDAPSAMPEWDVIGDVFRAIDAAWTAKHPLSMAPQAKLQGRYFPTLARERFGIPEKKAALLAQDWQMNGFLATETADKKAHVRGLRVIRFLTP